MYADRTCQLRQMMAENTAAFRTETQAENQQMAAELRMQLNKSQELAKVVVQMLSDIDVYVENLRKANQAMAIEVRQTLDADRSEFSAETAEFRSQTRSDHAAMASASERDLDEAQTALLDAVPLMSEQIAEFLANVRTANQLAADELRAKLDADRTELATSTDKMMADIDSFLAEIRSDPPPEPPRPGSSSSNCWPLRKRRQRRAWKPQRRAQRKCLRRRPLWPRRRTSRKPACPPMTR